mmetsp:Transcript_47788/g.75551  ORF Transcript_47788/g.75551 Transcript_47788/m.75551 type:complete len:172 (-) Transcript_47788:112-627(-)
MLGGVTIITMAKTYWVEDCINTLMPEVGRILKELGIEVVSARTSITHQLHREAMGDCRDYSQYLKKKAMQRVVKRFYRQLSSCLATMDCMPSWKNIISIGDSDAERLALQDAVGYLSQYDKYGRVQQCRCKTVRLVEEPSLEKLTEQLNSLAELLPGLVLHDGDVDLDANF